jgi:hypothetical protein
MYMAFVDQEKAFDTVKRNLLWRILKQYGISDNQITLLQSLYRKCYQCYQKKKNFKLF